MFTVTRSPLYDFNTLFHTLDSVNQYQQAQQLLQQQYEASRPKIVKKVETEDNYQIQIFKKQGNFNSYEVKVLRNAAYGNSNLINLVIESRRDEFRKVFQFNLSDIEVSEIDWEYFESDNVLVLNVPKKVKYCADDYVNSLLAGIFGLPGAPAVQQPPQSCTHCHHGANERKHRHKERRHRDREAKAIETARAEAEKAEAARIEAAKAEAARIQAARAEAEKKAAEERARREAELKARREAEEKARREAEERAKKIAQEKARRIAEVRAKKEAEAVARRQREEEERREQLRKQQEFVQALFGNVFPGFQFVTPETQRQEAESQPTPRAESSNANSVQIPIQPAEKPQVAENTFEDNEAVTGSESESETESIQSDISTPDSRASLKRSGDDLAGSAEKLHRHPSLEEVEDEEFVMFRKKFGEQ